MKTTLLFLVTFFYLFLGQGQQQVNEQIQHQGLPHRQGIFAGESATYIYDGDITHIISYRDSVVHEVGMFAPRKYYQNYQELCDSLFIRIGDDHFFSDNHRVAFFKANDPDMFFLVGYMGGEYNGY